MKELRTLERYQESKSSSLYVRKLSLWLRPWLHKWTIAHHVPTHKIQEVITWLNQAQKKSCPRKKLPHPEVGTSTKVPGPEKGVFTFLRLSMLRSQAREVVGGYCHCFVSVTQPASITLERLSVVWNATVWPVEPATWVSEAWRTAYTVSRL